ncbi:hypothetical protein NSS95_09460 [Weizmannia sp. FSL K6-3076]|uniref:hypothetical protein n=1 Tax=Weizmannia sp. FSL K6-3076 TaxID=2954542 RepID=UPI0030FA7832
MKLAKKMQKLALIKHNKIPSIASMNDRGLFAVFNDVFQVKVAFTSRSSEE